MAPRVRLRSRMAVVLLGGLLTGSLWAVVRSQSFKVLDTGDGSVAIQYGPFEESSLGLSHNVAVTELGDLTLVREGESFSPFGYVELPLVAPGTPFDMVHVGLSDSTPSDTSLLLQIRVTDQTTGQLSRWYPIERESELDLPSKATAAQVRIVMRSGSGLCTPRVSRVIVETLQRVDIAPPADETQPSVIPMPPLTVRQAWGARPPKDDYLYQDPTILTVHHTAQPDQASYVVDSTIRGIQSFHMDQRGWSDIGYHFLIGPEGRLYEGRPPAAVGAHAPPNTGKIGVSVIGNFHAGKDTVTPKQREVLVDLLAHLAGKYRIPAKRIFGHRDTQQTDCPGETLYAQLPAIRAEVDFLLTAARAGRAKGCSARKLF